MTKWFSPILACFVFAGVMPATARAADITTTVEVDLAKPGPTINPYIYGQFIEHMGRCIRGGIWAEMLRDRKFLLEPGKSWDVIGPEWADCEVAHDTAGAYAGDHSLAIWVRDAGGGTCGVRQGGLGLIEGKDYVGYAILRRVGEPAPVKVRLAWGEDEAVGQDVVLKDVGVEFRKIPFRFRAGADTDHATLTLTLDQPGYLWVSSLSLMPADNVRGLRADTLALLKRLDSPIYRWPGGNFVSGYHWKDGIGPRDRRPPRWERAWEGVEDNDFGVDEFLDFCREIETEPLIVVNTGLGSLEEALQELEYVNGGPTTPWGARRAEEGHPEPYGVTWWGIGNEMYGDWQLGNVPVERYAVRHNEFVRAIKQVDPTIKVVGVGAPGRWNDVVVPRSAASMDLLSMHHYTQRKFRIPFTPEAARRYEEGFLEYSGQVAAGVRHLIDDLRQRQDGRDPAVDRLRLAIDEWGIVREWDPEPDGPGTGIYEVYYPLGDAIANARALHEMIRAADLVELAQWAQTVNIIGAIKTSRTHASMGPVGHLLALYRAHLGGRVALATVAGDTPLDVIAARSREAETVSLGLINYSPSQDIVVRLDILGGGDYRMIRGWRIDGPGLDAINVPGRPEEVSTTELPGGLSPTRPMVLRRHSITVLEVR